MVNLILPENKLLIEIIHEESTTDSGIILNSTTHLLKPHDILRGKVLVAGYECKLVKVGDIVLFEHCFSRVANINTYLDASLQASNLRYVKESELGGIYGKSKAA